MRVTERTKYETFRSVEKYLTKEATEKLKKAAEESFGAMQDLTFAQFHACVNGNFADVLGNTASPTVLQAYWAKRFADFVEEFAGALKKLTLQQTADEVQASQGLLKVNWDEGLLVFIQSYFGLRSFKEAEQITIGEIIIAKRAQYNQELYRRKLNAIQMAKLKRK